MGYVVERTNFYGPRRASTGKEVAGAAAALAAFLVPAIAGIAVLYLTSSDSGKVFETEAGKKYKFFWKVTPALRVDILSTFATALQTAGGESITISQGSTETVGSHEMTAKTSQSLKVGDPLFIMGDTTLTLTSVKKVS